MSLRAFALALASTFGLVVAAGGCASSPYDKAWVDRAITEHAGAAARSDAPALEPSLPPKVPDLAALSSDDAVATALWNSRRFQVEIAQLGFARADLAEAGALPNPTLAFLFPIGPRQYEASVTYPVGTLLQMPSRVAMAKADVERTARSLVEVALDLARDVRIAHAELVLAERRVLVREDIAKTVAEVAKLTDARNTAGDVSLLERRAAQAEAATTLDAARRAPQDVTVARERLRRLLGYASRGSAPLGVRAESAPPWPPAADLERVAILSRPDVRGAEMGIDAAGDRLGWEKWKVLQLYARLDSKPVGTRGAGPNLFLPGAQVDIPIFNWNPGGRKRAEAQMEQATFRYLVVRDDIVTDVRLARVQVEQARGSLVPWQREIVPLLDANVTSAIRAFESGADSYLVVLEAVRRAQEAKLRVLDLEADLFRAHAALDRAVGRRIR